MRESILLLVLISWLSAAGACASASRHNTPEMVPRQPARTAGFGFDVYTGQWRVRGVIDRLEAGDGGYEYVTRPTLTFGDDANVATADGIRLRGVTFKASVFDAAAPPPNRRVLHVERRSISVHFAAGDATKTLPEVRFRLSRRIEMQADQITLEFDGPGVFVPTVLNLKGKYWR